MEETRVSFKTAKLAKEKGFPQWKDLPAGIDMSSYDIYKSGEVELNGVSEAAEECITAPTQSLLQKWLREEYEIHIQIIINYAKEGIRSYRCGIIFINNENKVDALFIRPKQGVLKDVLFIEFSTYEEALEEGLYESLKLLK